MSFLEMLEEDREAIRRMKADFEAIADLTDSEFKSNTGFARQMNHYNTVYTAATRTTNSKSVPELLGHGVDELLYMDFQEMLTRYLLKYRDLRATSETQMFTKVLKVWDHYKVLMKWNMRAFAYLSRFFIVNCSKPSLHEVALSIFLEQVLKRHAPTVSKVTQELLQAERKGENVSREQIRGAIELLSSMSIDKTQEVYCELFLKPYLTLTKVYYDTLLLEWSASNTPTEMLNNIEDVYSGEKARCTYYFSPEDKEKIITYVEEVLLDSPLTVDKLLKSCDGFALALRNHDMELLKSYYDLFSRREKGIDCMYTLTKDEIIRSGEERLRRHDCEERTIDFKSCVSDVMKLQDDHLNLLFHCFHGHGLIFKAIREGLEKVYSGGVYVSGGASSNPRRLPLSELFAYFIDDVIQERESTHEEILDRIIASLTYVTDRDTFLAHFRDLLAQRILFQRKKFDETLERSLIQRISHRLGVANTSFLEGMLHDVDVAEAFKAEEKLEAFGAKPPFAFNALVLKKGIWPLRIQSECFIPPRLLRETLQLFHQAFLDGTTGRVLTWSFSNSSGDVNASFKKGSRLFSMNGVQCWVILAFNDAKKLTTRDIMDLFSIPFEDLKISLLPLVKCSLLRRDSDSQTLEETDIFSINEDFSSKWKKIRIPATLVRISASKSETIAREVGEDRKPAIDACLVRIMKSRRLFSHVDLVEECHQQLSPLFSADHRLIKQRIEELIRKEFIERDQKNTGVYKYAA